MKSESVAQNIDAMDPRIEKFIKRHHVMTLATLSSGGDPWCCSLFYVYLAEIHTLVFSSSADTQHAQQAIFNSRVAGGIALESRVIGRLQGVQFTGVINSGHDQDMLRKAYLHRFPYAAPMLAQLWAVELERVKYTDNTLGFGSKLLWSAKK